MLNLSENNSLTFRLNYIHVPYSQKLKFILLRDEVQA